MILMEAVVGQKKKWLFWRGEFSLLKRRKKKTKTQQVLIKTVVPGLCRQRSAASPVVH